MGISNPKKFGGHCLRVAYCMKLVNDPTVNLKESMIGARHTSVSAHLSYLNTDNKSEVTCCTALGILTPHQNAEKLEQTGGILKKFIDDQKCGKLKKWAEIMITVVDYVVDF